MKTPLICKDYAGSAHNGYIIVIAVSMDADDSITVIAS